MLDCFEAKLARERLVSEESSIEGLGLFAKISFRQGDLITVMQGERISVPELKNRYRKGIERLSDPLQISERLYLDLNDPFVRINHSCDPNAAIVGETNLIALRPIEQGEELTYDYSLTEWNWNKFGKYAEWNIKCACGSQNCRGYVTQFPFIPLRLKSHYFRQKVLPNFIIRKIIKVGLAYKGE